MKIAPLFDIVDRTNCARMLRAAGRRGVFRFDGYSSRSRASLAEDPVAALTDAADAETPHAGLLGGWSDTIVMLREPAFSEFHVHVLWSAGFVKAAGTLSTAR
jgi:hypothetical protein